MTVVEAKSLPKEYTFCELILEKNQRQQSQLNKEPTVSPKWNEEFCL
jgi:hypothetical protein